jgi:uncharacterized protein HemX
MSALPPAPEPSPAPVPPPAPEPSTVDDAPARGAAPPAARSMWRSLRLLFWLVLILAAIAAALAGWRLRTDVDQTQSRLEQSERTLAAITQQAGKSERDAQLRIERLEADLARLRDQRSELDLLYMDLTRGRDEAALVEVDRLVNLAAQELQIGANTASAIAALQTADARLARIDRPQLVDLRRAITRDLERLRAAPSVDITGLALKIDQIAQGVDALPLLAEAITRSPAPAPASKAASKAAPADATEPRSRPQATGGPRYAAGCNRSSAIWCASATSTPRRRCCSPARSSSWRASSCGCACSMRARRC